MSVAPTAYRKRPGFVSLQGGQPSKRQGRVGAAKRLTYWETGFQDDGIRDLPEAVILVPARLPPDLLQVAIVTVPANERLHLLQELLEEHGVPLLPADGRQVIDLLQLELRLQVLDFHLRGPELSQG